MAAAPTNHHHQLCGNGLEIIANEALVNEALIKSSAT